MAIFSHIHSIPDRSKVFDPNCFILVEVFSYLRNEYIHASSYKKTIFLPDVFKKYLSVDDLIGVFKKQLQNLIFFIGKTMCMLMNHDALILKIETPEHQNFLARKTTKHH